MGADLSSAAEGRSTRGLLVVVSGPSGVGKGTVVAKAMSGRGAGAARLRRSVSVTTRSKRAEEKEGRDYFFRLPEKFARMAAGGELLEWATYLGHEYGTPAPWVDRQLEAGYDVVLEIEVQGAMQVRERRPGAVLIYMLPPSWPALKQRLRRRRSESAQIQQQRLEVAREEMKLVTMYDYVVVNDRVESAARRLLAILEAERCRVRRLEVSELFGEMDG